MGQRAASLEQRTNFHVIIIIIIIIWLTIAFAEFHSIFTLIYCCTNTLEFFLFFSFFLSSFGGVVNSFSFPKFLPLSPVRGYTKFQ